MSKISIRLYKDHKVRAVWDEEHNHWWFSVVDIVAAITESPNPRKYWSVLKTRLKKDNNELTTKCSQLKLTAADGKKYATDCLAQDDITAMKRSTTNPTAIKRLLQSALTDRIDDRELFMNGIDYSYYYEEED